MSSLCSSAHADEEDADEQIPPTLEQCHRMQQAELLRHLEELSRCEGGLSLVLDDGTELRASRIVLMASCEYFRRRLSSSWDGGTTRLELQGVTAPVVESVLRFLSSGSVAGLTAANAQDVLAYADFLGVAPLCGACRRLLAPDAVRTRPSLADFRTLVASHPAFTPPPPQQQAAFASITRNADLRPAGFTLVLQMARGTRLVLPFAERRSNTPELWGISALGHMYDISGAQADDPQQWPRHGEFRWLVPEGAQHEVEVCEARGAPAHHTLARCAVLHARRLLARHAARAATSPPPPPRAAPPIRGTPRAASSLRSWRGR